jgi:RNA recognition motif-containing protein
VLTPAEIDVVLRRLEFDGERAIRLDGNYKAVPQAEFLTTFPGCIRTIFKAEKYVVLYFSNKQSAITAFNQLQNYGFKNQPVTVKMHFNSENCTPEVQGKLLHDTGKVVLSNLPSSVLVDDLKVAFPGITEVMYNSIMKKKGRAVLKFQSPFQATQAFQAGLTYQGQEITVMYSRYEEQKPPKVKQPPPPPKKKNQVGAGNPEQPAKKLKKKRKYNDVEVVRETAELIPQDELKDMESRIKDIRNRTLYLVGNKLGDHIDQVLALNPDIKRVSRKRKGVTVEFDTLAVANRMRRELAGKLINNEPITVTSVEDAYTTVAQFRTNINPMKLYIDGLPLRTKRQDLRKHFPTAKEVFQSKIMFNTGKAMAIYKTLEDSRKAFKESRNLKIEGKRITVSYLIVRKGFEEEMDVSEPAKKIRA